ncbi:MAG: hypothetical protein U1F36_20015 [Planctomycetota bacterium]
MKLRLLLIPVLFVATACTTGAPRRFADVTVVDADAPRTQDPGNTDLRNQLGELQRRLGAEQQARGEAESRARTLELRVHELEGQVLSLSLERIRMEQELLRTRISALRSELGEPATDPAKPQQPTDAPITAPAPVVTDDMLQRIRIPGQDRR